MASDLEENRYFNKKVPKFVTSFLDGAYTGHNGRWSGLLYQSTIEVLNCGVKVPEWISVVESVAPEPLTKTDQKTIRSALKKFLNLEREDDRKGVRSIEAFVLDGRARIDLNGQYWLDGKEVGKDYLIDYIFIEAKKKKDRGVSKEVIEAYLNIYEVNIRNELMEQVRKNLSFEGDNREIEKFCKAVIVDDDNFEVSSAVLKHFIWQVKRKLNNQAVKMHMMPILSGKTGGGKSVAVNSLLSPIEELTADSDMGIFNDERNYKEFTVRYVIFLDEMAKASKVDVNSLKKMITSEFVTYRKLYSNFRPKGKNIASFIGATNDDVSDLIKDPTSARRYFEVKCKDTLEWDTINSIDYVKLWKGIDESKEDLYIDAFKNEVAKCQNEIKYANSFEKWVQYYEISPTSVDADKYWVSTEDLYFHYKAYCTTFNGGRQFAFTESKFSKLLTVFVGRSTIIKRMDGKRRRGHSLISGDGHKVTDSYDLIANTEYRQKLNF